MHKIVYAFCIFIANCALACPLWCKIDFTRVDMLLTPAQEWDSAALNIPFIEELLVRYYETGIFRQTTEEYRQQPEVYFTARLAALDNLLAGIEECENGHAYLEKLKQQAINKKRYMQALPDIREALANKPGFWGGAKMLIPLLDKYGLEALDPLHRLCKASPVYANRWTVSDIPNYFIYLDSVEADPLLNTYAPQDNHVRYTYTAEERERECFYFDNGLAKQNGGLVDTSDFQTKRNGKGVANYILGPDERFYLQDPFDETSRHSGVFGGDSIIGAGEISVSNGRITFISNRSGHYRPNEESLRHVLAHLKCCVGSLADIEQVGFKTQDNLYEFYFDADAFLCQGIKALPLPSTNSSPLHFAIQQDIRTWLPLAATSKYVDQLHQEKMPLHLAAEKGDLFWTACLLEAGASAYALDAQKLTPLELAAAAGKLDAIYLLYMATDDAAIRAKGILQAAKSGNVAAIQLFEQRGLCLQESDAIGNTIFHYAAMAADGATLSYLCSQLPDSPLLGQCNHFNQSPLHYAAAFGTAKTITALMQLGFSLSDTDADGNTLLHAAVKEGNISATEFLLELMPEELISQTNHLGILPLHYATATLPLELYKTLYEKTAAPDAADFSGNTPIFYACHSVRSEAAVNLCFLLENGADASRRNTQGYTAIHTCAMQKKRLLPLMTLLSYYDGLDDLTSEGDLPLHLALKASDKSTKKYLLKHATQTQLRQKNAEGLCALDMAAEPCSRLKK